VRVTIDNLDGAGAREYTQAVAAEGRVTVQRTLNAPSRCTFVVVEGALGLALPVRMARVVVMADDATVLFTGYVATEPVREYVGEASAGGVYRARVTAVSDEWLLDKASSGVGAFGSLRVGVYGREFLSRMVGLAQVGGGPIRVATSGGPLAAAGAIAVKPAEPWSVNAGAAAGASYAGYTVLDGQINLQPVGYTTHVLRDADGTLQVAELTTAAMRELANDVTVSGAEEPAAFVEEIFMGDGVTTVFGLRDAAFRTSAATLVRDSFTEATLDVSQWVGSDPGSKVSLTSTGLTVDGGTGVDGATTVSALNVVEMGGTIVAELGGVVFGAGSDGMLAGFYDGASVLADCFAGFRVRQSVSGTGTVTECVPVVHGAEVGAVFTPVAGHAYTLRLRLHCVEVQRVPQIYSCMVDGVVQRFGSASGMDAPMDVVFELVDEGGASNTPATVLYDSAAVSGSVTGTPSQCVFVLVNSTSLFGSIASVTLTQPGTLWVVSTLPSGTMQTRLIGTAGTGVDCEARYGTQAGTAGSVTFFAGRVPVANERVSVFYRTERRSVARLENAESVAAEAAGGGNGTCRWLGKVLEPVARSSADCEQAALAVLAMATARSAAVAGTYACVNPSVDVWPGDVLAVTSEGVTSSLLVRSVTVTDGGCVPEVRAYKIAFANDWATEWADGLGLKLSEKIAADALLPQTASVAASEVLANLQQLTVTGLTETALQVDAGTAPPAGGGFEVRRKDWAFGEGVDAMDLVLRSSVRSFTVPRAAQVEQFFVRMYDGSSPPIYSRWSSAVFVNWPVS